VSDQEHSLLLTSKQRAEIHDGIAHTLHILKSLRGSVALRQLSEVNACREELHAILGIIDSSQGSQALPDPDDHQ
jgi:hypothetical protein